MRLSAALKDKLMDVRLRDKLLEDGRLKKDQVTTYVNGLADDINNVTYTNVNYDKRGQMPKSVED